MRFLIAVLPLAAALFGFPHLATAQAASSAPTYRCIGLNSELSTEEILFQLSDESLAMRFGESTVAGPLELVLGPIADDTGSERKLLIVAGGTEFRLMFRGLDTESVEIRMIATARADDPTELLVADCAPFTPSDVLESIAIPSDPAGEADQPRGWLSLSGGIQYSCAIMEKDGSIFATEFDLYPNPLSSISDGATINFGGEDIKGETVAALSTLQDGQMIIFSFLDFGRGKSGFGGSITGTGHTLIITTAPAVSGSADGVAYGKGACASQQIMGERNS